ncbi:MAG: ABC transporter permease [Alphaproteobacteria bacterium]|nr:ABC transporter permease [Alphaproteobacteria bacterium]
MIVAVARRIALSLLTLVLLAIFVFVATEIMPGDALDVTLSADELAMIPPERLAQMKRELGLDRPAAERLVAFLAGTVQLDFGLTIISRTPAADIIAYPLRNSVLLAGAVLAAAIPLALALGVAAAYRYRRALDNAVSAGAIIGYSVPEFVIATVLVILFAVLWPLFPATITAATRDPAHVLLAAAPLPVATVLIGSIAYLARILRVGMIEALASDFVERLRLTGVPEWRVLLLHALPAGVIPSLTAMALYAASLVSGIVVVELVFAYPGLGQELVRAVTRREVHVIQAIALSSAVVVVGLNLVADLAILLLDPRTRR